MFGRCPRDGQCFRYMVLTNFHTSPIFTWRKLRLRDVSSPAHSIQPVNGRVKSKSVVCLTPELMICPIPQAASKFKRGRNVSCKFLHKYESLFTGKQWRNKHRKQTYGHGERGGEGEMCGKSNMQTYITVCKRDGQGEFGVWLRKLKQGLCIDLEGWDGEGDGREVQKGGDIGIPMANSC